MLTKTWRRLRSPAAWAFVLGVGTPMLAEAQQGGLFPLAPIRRERVPCPLEDPVYGLYRHEYYGYHPTCWRKFPMGWGCPSPEAPNSTEAFRKRQLDPAPPLGNEGPPPIDGEAMPNTPDAPNGNNPLPPVPPADRSPFELDTKPSGNAPPRPGPGMRTPPPADSNPLDVPPPVGELPEKPATPPEATAVPPTSRLEPPATATPTTAPTAENPPLLTLPDPPASASATAVPVPASPNLPAVSEPGPSAAMSQPPVQAPRRTSLLGSLFGGFGRRRR